jgi:hypothetical protein
VAGEIAKRAADEQTMSGRAVNEDIVTQGEIYTSFSDAAERDSESQQELACDRASFAAFLRAAHMLIPSAVAQGA